MPVQPFVPPPPPGFTLEGSSPGGGGGANIPPKVREQAFGKLTNARMLERQLAEAERLYTATQKRPGIGNQIREFFPSRENGAFDAAVATLKPLAVPFFRTPGEGESTEGDAARVEAPLPNRFSMDSTNDQRFADLKRIIADTKREQGPLAGSIEEGTTIVNRQTGQRMQMKGGQWRKL
jgi:hypothetical protein